MEIQYLLRAVNCDQGPCRATDCGQGPYKGGRTRPGPFARVATRNQLTRGDACPWPGLSPVGVAPVRVLPVEAPPTGTTPAQGKWLLPSGKGSYRLRRGRWRRPSQEEGKD
ncbi:hypothetical protein GW17_00059583 [Ensete ventricosum]|nr:hypothetical protein GW17_00059583 [Ensete ventricosum]